MLSAKKAWERSKQIREENVKPGWKKTKKKIKSAIKSGNSHIKCNNITYKIRKKLKKRGFEIFRSEDGYETISWKPFDL